MTTAEIIAAFNRLFGASYNTRLRGGAQEPLYLAAGDEFQPGEIHFRQDYASSALHEIAHWCIAGKRRRLQDDYGYWYRESRDALQQAEFESLESRPQALEWIFSVAAGVGFRVSCDNFDEASLNLENLRRQVRAKARCYISKGLPNRAALMADTLADYSGVLNYAEASQFEGLPK